MTFFDANIWEGRINCTVFMDIVSSQIEKTDNWHTKKTKVPKNEKWFRKPDCDSVYCSVVHYCAVNWTKCLSLDWLHCINVQYIVNSLSGSQINWKDKSVLENLALHGCFLKFNSVQCISKPAGLNMLLWCEHLSWVGRSLSELFHDCNSLFQLSLKSFESFTSESTHLMQDLSWVKRSFSELFLDCNILFQLYFMSFWRFYSVQWINYFDPTILVGWVGPVNC